MKKGKLILIMMFVVTALSAQKFAFIDSEYILKQIPAYESAQDQLDQVSQRWQQEVDALMDEVKTLYKNYQNDLVFLSEEMKVKRENAIVEKEGVAKELRKKYFGPEGELFKKRESLVKPIQDEVYNAVKEVADDGGYSVIYDKTSAMDIVYASASLDVSEKVVEKLGYSKKE
jgi:outer membrane protein